MIEWARKVQRFVVDVPELQCLKDERTQSAVIHGLIVIGEIAARVSDDARDAHPEIPWHDIRGMRNRLAHDYLGIDVDVVWRTVSVDVPQLEPALESALGQR